MTVSHTRRLFAEVLDTETAIRAQDRPHSRSLNLVSLPISHIGNRRLADSRNRVTGEKKKNRSIVQFCTLSGVLYRDRRGAQTASRSGYRETVLRQRSAAD